MQHRSTLDFDFFPCSAHPGCADEGVGQHREIITALARAAAGPNRKEGKPDCRHVTWNATRLTEACLGTITFLAATTTLDGDHVELAASRVPVAVFEFDHKYHMVRKGKIEVVINQVECSDTFDRDKSCDPISRRG